MISQQDTDALRERLSHWKLPDVVPGMVAMVGRKFWRAMTNPLYGFNFLHRRGQIVLTYADKEYGPFRSRRLARKWIKSAEGKLTWRELQHTHFLSKVY